MPLVTVGAVVVVSGRAGRHGRVEEQVPARVELREAPELAPPDERVAVALVSEDAILRFAVFFHQENFSVERGRFNDVVQSYDTSVHSFPSAITASMFGFADKPYFAAAETAATAPSVNFNFNK